jgi:hypothetical protein
MPAVGRGGTAAGAARKSYKNKSHQLAQVARDKAKALACLQVRVCVLGSRGWGLSLLTRPSMP